MSNADVRDELVALKRDSMLGSSRSKRLVLPSGGGVEPRRREILRHWYAANPEYAQRRCATAPRAHRDDQVLSPRCLAEIRLCEIHQSSGREQQALRIADVATAHKPFLQKPLSHHWEVNAVVGGHVLLLNPDALTVLHDRITAERGAAPSYQRLA